MEREDKRTGEKPEARERESHALLRQMSGVLCTAPSQALRRGHITGRSMDTQTRMETHFSPPRSGRR